MLYDRLLDAQIAQRPTFLSTLCPSSASGEFGNVPAAIGGLGSLATTDNNVKRRHPFPGLAQGLAEFSPAVSSYYQRSDNSGLSVHAGASGVMSIEFVTRLSGTDYGVSGGFWVSKWNTTGPVAEFIIGYNSSGNPLALFGTSAGATVMTLTYSRVLQLSRGYHIAVEYDRALPRLSMFVNGVEESTTTASGTTSDTVTVLTIGRRMDGTRHVDGRMSHMAVYPRRLGRGVWLEHAALALR